MTIKRIINFDENEKETLVAAGTILGTIRDRFEANEIDELDTEAKSLLVALKTVIEKLVRE